MQSRKFMREIDFQKLNEWLHAHGHEMVEEAELPISGFVIEDGGAEIAMGFLRMVEGDISIMESVVTDPLAPMIRRVKAIDSLTERIIEVAKARNIKAILITTSSTGVQARASRRHGFVKSDQVLLVKKL